MVIHAGVSWRWIWPAIAVVALAVGVWAAATDSGEPMAAGGAEPTSTSHPLRRLRRDGLLVLLAVFALAEITEGGVDTWGVLYLRNHLATGVLLGAGAYVVGQAVAATTRGAGGPVLGRLSSRHALIIGGCVAGAGILLESLTSLSGLAAVGLALGRGRRVAVLAARHEHGQPHGEPGRQRGRGRSRRPATSVGWPGRPSSVGSPRPSGRRGGCRSSRWPPSGWPACTLLSRGPGPSAPPKGCTE